MRIYEDWSWYNRHLFQSIHFVMHIDTMAVICRGVPLFLTTGCNLLRVRRPVRLLQDPS